VDARTRGKCVGYAGGQTSETKAKTKSSPNNRKSNVVSTSRRVEEISLDRRNRWDHLEYRFSRTDDNRRTTGRIGARRRRVHRKPSARLLERATAIVGNSNLVQPHRNLATLEKVYPASDSSDRTPRRRHGKNKS